MTLIQEDSLLAKKSTNPPDSGSALQRARSFFRSTSPSIGEPSTNGGTLGQARDFFRVASGDPGQGVPEQVSSDVEKLEIESRGEDVLNSFIERNLYGTWDAAAGAQLGKILGKGLNAITPRVEFGKGENIKKGGRFIGKLVEGAVSSVVGVAMLGENMLRTAFSTPSKVPAELLNTGKLLVNGFTGLADAAFDVTTEGIAWGISKLTGSDDALNAAKRMGADRELPKFDLGEHFTERLNKTAMAKTMMVMNDLTAENKIVLPYDYEDDNFFESMVREGGISYFLTDNFAPGIGSTLGFLGAGKFAGRGVSAAVEGTAGALSWVNRLSKAAKKVNPVESAGTRSSLNKGLMFEVVKKGATELGTLHVMTASESAMEAVGVYNEMMGELLPQKYEALRAQGLDDAQAILQAEKEADKEASSISDSVYMDNYAMLLLTNKIELASLKGLKGKFVPKGYAKTKTGRILGSTGRVATPFVSEGLEEGFQTAAVEYEKKMRGSADDNNVTDLALGIYGTLGDALWRGDKETWLSVVTGGLSGTVSNAVGRGIKRYGENRLKGKLGSIESYQAYKSAQTAYERDSAGKLTVRQDALLGKAKDVASKMVQLEAFTKAELNGQWGLRGMIDNEMMGDVVYDAMYMGSGEVEKRVSGLFARTPGDLIKAVGLTQTEIESENVDAEDGTYYDGFGKPLTHGEFLSMREAQTRRMINSFQLSRKFGAKYGWSEGQIKAFYDVSNTIEYLTNAKSTLETRAALLNKPDASEIDQAQVRILKDDVKKLDEAIANKKQDFIKGNFKEIFKSEDSQVPASAPAASGSVAQVPGAPAVTPAAPVPVPEVSQVGDVTNLSTVETSAIATLSPSISESTEVPFKTELSELQQDALYELADDVDSIQDERLSQLGLEEQVFVAKLLDERAKMEGKDAPIVDTTSTTSLLKSLNARYVASTKLLRSSEVGTLKAKLNFDFEGFNMASPGIDAYEKLPTAYKDVIDGKVATTVEDVTGLTNRGITFLYEHGFKDTIVEHFSEPKGFVSNERADLNNEGNVDEVLFKENKERAEKEKEEEVVTTQVESEEKKGEKEEVSQEKPKYSEKTRKSNTLVEQLYFKLKQIRGHKNPNDSVQYATSTEYVDLLELHNAGALTPNAKIYAEVDRDLLAAVVGRIGELKENNLYVQAVVYKKGDEFVDQNTPGATRIPVGVLRDPSNVTDSEHVDQLRNVRAAIYSKMNASPDRIVKLDTPMRVMGYPYKLNTSSVPGSYSTMTEEFLSQLVSGKNYEVAYPFPGSTQAYVIVKKSGEASLMTVGKNGSNKSEVMGKSGYSKFAITREDWIKGINESSPTRMSPVIIIENPDGSHFFVPLYPRKVKEEESKVQQVKSILNSITPENAQSKMNELSKIVYWGKGPNLKFVNGVWETQIVTSLNKVPGRIVEFQKNGISAIASPGGTITVRVQSPSALYEALDIGNMTQSTPDLNTFSSELAGKIVSRIKSGFYLTNVSKSNPHLPKDIEIDYGGVTSNAVYEALGVTGNISDEQKQQKANIERRRQEELDKANKHIEKTNKKEDRRVKVETYRTLDIGGNPVEVEITINADGSRVLRARQVNEDGSIEPMAYVTERINNKAQAILTNEQLVEAYIGNEDNTLQRTNIDENPDQTYIDKINAKYDAELAKLNKQTTSEQKQEAQQRYSQYLEQNPNGDIEGFKEFVQGKPNSVKPGVEELFSENPELANEVYSALGFGQERSLPTRKQEAQENNTEAKKADIERRRQEELNQQTDAGYSIIALDYLFTGGRDVILSTDYLLQALVGGFTYSAKEINDIRNKYADKLGNIKDDINSDVYNQMMNEIRDVINKNYNDSKATEIFDKILKNATGFTNREGNQTSIELDKLNEQNESKINAKYDAELAKLNKQTTSEQKQEAQQRYSQYLEQNPNGDIEGFKEFVQGKPNSVKPGVEELFSENPELANEVYSALGFGQERSLPTRKQEAQENNTEAKKDDIERSLGITLTDEEIEVLDYLSGQKNQMKDFYDNKGLLTILGRKLNSIAEQTGKKLAEAISKKLGFKVEDVKVSNNLGSFDVIKQYQTKDSKPIGDYEQLVYNYLNAKYDAELAELNNQITPEQKQQAQQLYSEFIGGKQPIIARPIVRGTDTVSELEHRSSMVVKKDKVYESTVSFDSKGEPKTYKRTSDYIKDDEEGGPKDSPATIVGGAIDRLGRNIFAGKSVTISEYPEISAEVFDSIVQQISTVYSVIKSDPDNVIMSDGINVFSDEFNVAGELDIVIYNRTSKALTIVDMKTFYESDHIEDADNVRKVQAKIHRTGEGRLQKWEKQQNVYRMLIENAHEIPGGVRMMILPVGVYYDAKLGSSVQLMSSRVYKTFELTKLDEVNEVRVTNTGRTRVSTEGDPGLPSSLNKVLRSIEGIEPLPNAHTFASEEITERFTEAMAALNLPLGAQVSISEMLGLVKGTELEKLFSAASTTGLTVRFVENPGVAAAYYSHKDHEVVISLPGILNKYAADQEAQGINKKVDSQDPVEFLKYVLTHEVKHGYSAGMLELYEFLSSNNEGVGAYFNEREVRAIEQLNSIFNTLMKDPEFRRATDITNVKELLAELDAVGLKNYLSSRRMSVKGESKSLLEWIRGLFSTLLDRVFGKTAYDHLKHIDEILKTGGFDIDRHRNFIRKFNQIEYLGGYSSALRAVNTDFMADYLDEKGVTLDNLRKTKNLSKIYNEIKYYVEFRRTTYRNLANKVGITETEKATYEGYAASLDYLLELYDRPSFRNDLARDLAKLQGVTLFKLEDRFDLEEADDPKESWMEEYGSVNPVEAGSKSIRALLRGIPKIRRLGPLINNRRKVAAYAITEYGTIAYEDENNMFYQLLHGLSGLQSRDQIIPKLEELAESKAWIYHILDEIDKNKLLVDDLWIGVSNWATPVVYRLNTDMTDVFQVNSPSNYSGVFSRIKSGFLTSIFHHRLINKPVPSRPEDFIKDTFAEYGLPGLIVYVRDDSNVPVVRKENTTFVNLAYKHSLTDSKKHLAKYGISSAEAEELLLAIKPTSNPDRLLFTFAAIDAVGGQKLPEIRDILGKLDLSKDGVLSEKEANTFNENLAKIRTHVRDNGGEINTNAILSLLSVYSKIGINIPVDELNALAHENPSKVKATFLASTGKASKARNKFISDLMRGVDPFESKKNYVGSISGALGSVILEGNVRSYTNLDGDRKFGFVRPNGLRVLFSRFRDAKFIEHRQSHVGHNVAPIYELLKDPEFEFELIEIDGISGTTSYRNSNKNQLLLQSLNAWHASEDGKGVFALPTVSTAPVRYYVKATNFTKEEVIEKMLFVLNQELNRYEASIKGGKTGIKEYDANVSTSMWFAANLEKLYNKLKDSDARSSREMMMSVVKARLEKNAKEVIAAYSAAPIDLDSGLDTRIPQDLVELFAYNDLFYTTQLQTLLFDPNFVKSLGVYGKRFKGVHTPGIYHELERKFLVVDDQIGSSSKELIELVNKYAGTKDYTENNRTDGGAIVSIHNQREILKKKREWTDQHEVVYNKLINGIPLTGSERLVSFGHNKPHSFFHRSITLANNMKVLVPTQLKYAEFVLNPAVAYAKDKSGNYLYPELAKIQQTFDKRNADDTYAVDGILFKSTVKHGLESSHVLSIDKLDSATSDDLLVVPEFKDVVKTSEKSYNYKMLLGSQFIRHSMALASKEQYEELNRLLVNLIDANKKTSGGTGIVTLTESDELSATYRKSMRLRVPGAVLTVAPSVRNDLKSYVDETGSVVMEALIPLWDEIVMDAVTNEKGELDIDLLPDYYREAIAYRVPTEAGHSIMRLKVVGFSTDSTIYLPQEYSKITDGDMDDDKMYVLLKKPGVKVSKDWLKVKSKELKNLLFDDFGIEDENINTYSTLLSYIDGNLENTGYDYELNDVLSRIVNKSNVTYELSDPTNKQTIDSNRLVGLLRNEIYTNEGAVREQLVGASLSKLETLLENVRNVYGLVSKTGLYSGSISKIDSTYMNVEGIGLVGKFATAMSFYSMVKNLGEVPLSKQPIFYDNLVLGNSVETATDGSDIRLNLAIGAVLAVEAANTTVGVDLGVTRESSSVVAYMLMLGFSWKDVAYFLNKPSVKKAIEESTGLSKAKYSRLLRGKLKEIDGLFFNSSKLHSAQDDIAYGLFYLKLKSMSSKLLPSMLGSKIETGGKSMAGFYGMYSFIRNARVSPDKIEGMLPEIDYISGEFKVVHNSNSEYLNKLYDIAASELNEGRNYGGLNDTLINIVDSIAGDNLVTKDNIKSIAGALGAASVQLNYGGDIEALISDFPDRLINFIKYSEGTPNLRKHLVLNKVKLGKYNIKRLELDNSYSIDDGLLFTLQNELYRLDTATFSEFVAYSAFMYPVGFDRVSTKALLNEYFFSYDVVAVDAIKILSGLRGELRNLITVIEDEDGNLREDGTLVANANDLYVSFNKEVFMKILEIDENTSIYSKVERISARHKDSTFINFTGRSTKYETKVEVSDKFSSTEDVIESKDEVVNKIESAFMALGVMDIIYEVFPLSDIQKMVASSATMDEIVMEGMKRIQNKTC